MRILFVLLALLLSCAKDNSNSSQALTERAPEEIKPEPSPYCAFGALPKNWVRAEDYLSFANFGYRGVGRCRGHALLTQELIYLLRFDPTLADEWSCWQSSEYCRNAVYEMLQKTKQGLVVTVPGFKNLAEFSSAPLVEAILRGRIISYETRYSARRLPLPGYNNRSIAVFEELKKRTRLHQRPYVAINGALVGSHGVLADHVERNVVCVRDPNLVPESGIEECQNYFYREGDIIRYVRSRRPEDTVSLELTEDENQRSRQLRASLCP